MSKNKEFVKFEKVDKSYDGKILVVKDLNLDISEGEFITMLGPSGSGKTTCLMMLAGFETPTNGEIYLDKNPISNIPPHKRGIGMVFQNYALFPHMTVYENLAFPLRVRKIPKDEADKKIDKALSMVSLSGFENRMPGRAFCFQNLIKIPLIMLYQFFYQLHLLEFFLLLMEMLDFHIQSYAEIKRSFETPYQFPSCVEVYLI